MLSAGRRGRAAGGDVVEQGHDRLAPGLLIATPTVRDPFFAETVILLIDHDDDGAYGVVLNRRADPKLGDLLQRLDLPAPTPTKVSSVWWGGPVQPEAGMVLFLDEPGLSEYEPSLIVAPGLRASWSMELLRDIAFGRGPTIYAFYLGRAGWGEGQLEEELNSGAWIPADLNRTLLFREHDDGLWRDALRDIGAQPAAIPMGDAALA
jgi:putative transcriptional regulator